MKEDHVRVESKACNRTMHVHRHRSALPLSYLRRARRHSSTVHTAQARTKYRHLLKTEYSTSIKSYGTASTDAFVRVFVGDGNGGRLARDASSYCSGVGEPPLLLVGPPDLLV